MRLQRRILGVRRVFFDLNESQYNNKSSNDNKIPATVNALDIFGRWWGKSLVNRRLKRLQRELRVTHRAATSRSEVDFVESTN